MTDSATPASLTLALRLVDAGLIQFGRFSQPDGSVGPVRVHLGWLSSYPALLRDIAAALADLLTGLAVDRLLTTSAAVPLGTALSLHTGLPMTYAHGGAPDRPLSIEGAYDVGHPTIMLSDVLTGADHAQQLIGLARHVGLDVHSVLVALDMGLGATGQLQAKGYRVLRLMALPDLLPPLAERGHITASLYAAIQRWLADRQATAPANL